MNVTAHRSMVMALSIQNPLPVPPVIPTGPAQDPAETPFGAGTDGVS